MARLFDDGSSQYLHIDSAIVGTYPLSMACWFYSNADTGSVQHLMWVGRTDSAIHYLALLLLNSTDQVWAQSREQAENAIATASYTYGTWHHACGVWASTTSRAVYLDGGNKGTDTNESNDSAFTATAIGRASDSTPGGYMNGRIAEAAAWNVALTDSEVAVLAAGYSSHFVRPESRIYDLPMVRDNDEDLVGGLSMTPVNGPTVAAHPPIIYPAPPIFYSIPSAAGAPYTLTASQGSYTLSGQVANILSGRLLTAGQGSYVLTGQAATFARTRALVAAQGSYVLAGQTVGLSYSGGEIFPNPDNAAFVKFRDARTIMKFRDKREVVQ